MCMELRSIDWLNLTADFATGKEIDAIVFVCDSRGVISVETVTYELIDTRDLLAESFRLGGIAMARETLDYRDMMLSLKGAVADYNDTVERLNAAIDGAIQCPKCFEVFDLEIDETEEEVYNDWNSKRYRK